MRGGRRRRSFKHLRQGGLSLEEGAQEEELENNDRHWVADSHKERIIRAGVCVVAPAFLLSWASSLHLPRNPIQAKFAEFQFHALG